MLHKNKVFFLSDYLFCVLDIAFYLFKFDRCIYVL